MTIAVQIQHDFQSLSLDLNFEAPAGVTAIFGPSGAGKTTLLRSVAGLMRPDRGRIEIAGRAVFDNAKRISVPPRQRDLAVVFQEARLFPHMSVAQNLTYGARARGLQADAKTQAQICELLGLGDLLERRPLHLSGGEKQRVALARALLSHPKMLLLDEPLAALDAARKDEILGYLERLRDDWKMPMLYVSHSVSEVARLADTIAMIKSGRLAKLGPVERVFSDTETADALGQRESGAILLAKILKHHADGLSELQGAGGRLFVPGATAKPGDQIRLRIRASDVMLARHKPEDVSALNILSGSIQQIRAGKGPGVLVQIACGQALILSRITKRSAQAMDLAVGQEIFAIVKSVSVARSDIGT